MFGTLAITHRQVKAGKLSALGVSTVKRTHLLPEVPTIAEAGVPGYSMSTWWGVIAPAGVPSPIVQKLHGEIDGIVGNPESKQRFEGGGAEPAPLASREFGRLLASEVETWRRVARESNIKAQ